MALALGGACKFTPPVPIAYVNHGPAYGQPINPIAALPVSCGFSTMGCHLGYQVMVANATRMALELGGGSLVDSELINAELRLRTTHTRSTVSVVQTHPSQVGVMPSTTTQGSSASTTEVTGTTWLDLPPIEQRALLQDLGIRSVLRANIALGVPHGLSGQRTVTVQLALIRLADEAIAWESECGVETGDYHSEPQAVELAARCALESATLW